MAALVPRVNADDWTSLSQQPEETQQLFIDVHGKENAPYVWRDEHNNFLKKEAERLRHQKQGETSFVPDLSDPIVGAGARAGARFGDAYRENTVNRAWADQVLNPLGETIGGFFSGLGSASSGAGSAVHSAIENPPGVGIDKPPPSPSPSPSPSPPVNTSSSFT